MKSVAVLLTAVLTAMPALPALAADAPIVVPLDAGTLDRMPHERAQMEVHGQALDCSGVPLAALLKKAGAMPDTPLRGPLLARIVDVQAADGYRVVFSLGELEAGLGKTRVLLADQCAGKPLDTHDGPLRLLVPGDGRPARSVRQVNRITVRTP